MSLEAVEAARSAWFTAPDLEAQFAAVQALQQQAGPGVEWAVRKCAMGHLIELIHISDHPALRARLIEALGVVQSLQVVPALHAELHHADPTVRRTAVQVLGELGSLFAGVVVARWMKARDRTLEPPGMMDAALHALALTGHPDTARWALELWNAGEVEAASVHLALAEVVSSEGQALAREHLEDPVAAIPAALHLSAVRHPDLRALLKPMVHSSDLHQIQVAEALSERRWETAQDDVMAYITSKIYGRDVGRRARRLRVHPPEELVTVFELFRDEHPIDSRARATFLSRMASIGVPALQAAMFDWMLTSGIPSDIVPVLRSACTRHPAMGTQLQQLTRHTDPEVVVHALRCRVNLLEDLRPDDLARWVHDPRPAVAQESVRSVVALFRDRKGTDRRTSLTGTARRAIEQMVRQALREGDTPTRVQAAFAVGNLGLTALSDSLLRLRTDAAAGVRQGAAASLHALPPARTLDALVAWMAEEPAPDVRMRLGLTLLTALQDGAAVPDGLDGIATRARADREDLVLLGLHLCGFVRTPAAVDHLQSAARDPRLATASAALSALGATGAPGVIATLAQASALDDPIRQRRAVEALGAVGSPAAASVLVQIAIEALEPAVRRAALRCLAACPCTAMEARGLVPRGESDALMYELLEARVAAAGGRLDVAAVDAGLEERFEGLQTARLARQSQDALRALRTAHFLDSGVTLPEGLDAAPPVVFWAKGLELWMDVVMRPVIQELRSPRGRTALQGVAYIWSTLEGKTPGWTPGGGSRWKNLIRVLQRSAADTRKVWTLRALAGGVLCGGPLATQLGLPVRLSRAPSERLGELAHDLVCLSDLRNRLTHNHAGHAHDAVEARTRAEAIGRCLGRYF